MIEDIRNYLALTEKLSSSGMPTAEQLSSVAETGIRVVVNLATASSAGAIPNEKELVESLGMTYFNIPVDWNNPTRKNLDDFLHLMDEHAQSNVLVHCQANFRATGFITLYRIIRLGWKREDAWQDLRKIWNPQDYPIWHKFMEENLGTGDK